MGLLDSSSLGIFSSSIFFCTPTLVQPEATASGRVELIDVYERTREPNTEYDQAAEQSKPERPLHLHQQALARAKIRWTRPPPHVHEHQAGGNRTVLQGPPMCISTPRPLSMVGTQEGTIRSWSNGPRISCGDFLVSAISMFLGPEVSCMCVLCEPSRV